MFTQAHTTPLHLLPIFLNMVTGELPVNTQENKVTGITYCIWKSNSDIFM